MTKIETITSEIEHCGMCASVDYSPIKGDKRGHKCHKTKRVIPDLWGEIPSFCPLPDKEE